MSQPATLEADTGQGKTSLLLFTLGPVQGFIAAGRRTADLWAGSMLLSRLAKVALDSINTPGVNIVFPAVDEGTDEPEGRAAYPNRILAQVSDGCDPAKLASDAEGAIRKYLADAAEDALERVGLSSIHAAEAANFVDIYWVALPEDAGTVGHLYADIANDYPYGHLYRAVEGLMGSRKALRNFDGRTESGYRCTLMPERPAIVPNDDPGPGDVREWWKGISSNSGSRIREGERLSAIALTKRFYPDYLHEQGEINEEDKAFPSTSSFAASDFVKDVIEKAKTDDNLAGAVDAFESAIKDFPHSVQNRYKEAVLPGIHEALKEHSKRNLIGSFHRRSGRLLIGDDLTEGEIKKETDVDVEAAVLEQLLKQLANARSNLLDAATKAGIDLISRYYAILVLDGDKMGEWLSGKRGKGAFGGKKDSKRHQAISEALNKFASKCVPSIFEQQALEQQALGKLVYGGGDDVVALLSFKTALGTAEKIREAFGTAFKHSDATVSAGLVFAHHLTPLQYVLTAAHDAEKRAKKGGRNRICLTALKRSGSTEEVVVRWEDLEPLKEYAKRIREGTFSKGLLYDFRNLRKRLANRDGQLDDAMNDMLFAEAARLFGRRAEGLSEKSQKKRSYNDTIDQMRIDADGPGAEEIDIEDDPQALFDAVLDRMALAQFMGRGGDR